MLSVFKLHFSKARAKEISYRNFRNIQNRLSAESVEEYTPFEKFFFDFLNKNAPLKKKVARATHVAYITKTLRKVIMKRSYLERRYINDHTRIELQIH